jgi:uncharacterized repeat protein (TIGR01451 family)
MTRKSAQKLALRLLAILTALLVAWPAGQLAAQADARPDALPPAHLPLLSPVEHRLFQDHADGDTITGAQTVSGTWGPGVITATTDVDIQAGVVITVAPGTTIHIATTDGLNTGIDAARIEFIVQAGAELRIDGPVTWTSQAAAPAPADWYGIRYLEGSGGWVSETTIEYGVHALTLGTTNPVAVTHSRLRYNLHAPSAGADAFGAGLLILDGNHLIDNTDIYNNAVVATGSDAEVYGAGIDIQAGAPQILDCRIYGNRSTSVNSFGGGGGVAVRAGSAPLLQYSEVTSNSLTTAQGLGSGGGIGIYGNTQAVLRDSLVAGNLNNAAGQSGGGGIGFASYARAALIGGNVISGNRANGDYAEGGGIDTWSNNVVTVSNNLIYNNVAVSRESAASRGGAMLINGDPAAGDVNVVNNTIVNNAADHGGGLYRQADGTTFNNVIAGNTGADLAGGVYTKLGAGGAAGYNDVWNNTPDNYYATAPATDMQVNPLFVGAGDIAHRYHVRQGSPVINAGAYAGAGAPDDDYDGQARPLGANRDMGFDEVDTFKYQKSVDAVVAAGNDTLSYSIVITNPDPLAPVSGGQIIDPLPSGATYSAAPPTCNLGSCNYDSGTDSITWTGAIPPNAILTLDYSVLVDGGLSDGDEIINAAQVLVGGMDTWSNAVSTNIYNPAFTLAKSVTGTLIAGLPFTYTVFVTNTSARAAASGVIVADALPAGANYVRGGDSFDGATVQWAGLDLAANDTTWLTFAVSTCQTSLLNEAYYVAGSDQGVTSGWGAPLRTSVASPDLRAGLICAPSGVSTGETVHFTDTSSTNGGPIVAWHWDFGDGSGASTDQHPSYAYSVAGDYTITLTVTDTCGYEDSLAWPNAVTVCDGAKIINLESDSPVLLGETVHLSATVQGAAPISFTWDFDGAGVQGGTDANPTFVYAAPGVYTVTLNVENACGADSKSIVLAVQAPDISVTPRFFDLTLYAGNTWTRTLAIANLGDAPLDWGDLLEYPGVDWLSGTPISGSIPAGGDADTVTLAFDSSGLSDGAYTTTLRLPSNDPDEPVVDVDVTLVVTSVACVPVSGVHIAYAPLAPQVGQTVRFTGTVQAGSPTLAYAWDLGDGETGTGATIVHSYPVALNYTVWLTATSSCDGSSSSDQVDLRIFPSPQPDPFRLCLPILSNGNLRHLYLPMLMRGLSLRGVGLGP